MLRSFPQIAVAALVLFVLAITSVQADPILEIDSDTLESYLPSTASNVQDIRPLLEQRGVAIEGSAILGGAVSMSASPSNRVWAGQSTLAGVRLATGAVQISEVDLRFPATVPWVIGRSYNARQQTSGGSYRASSGYQGMNWFQSSQPELVFYDDATDADDRIYLIYGADRFIEFRRGDDAGVGDSTDTFQAVNGAAGVILIETNASAPDLATYTTQTGMQMVFFWHGDADTDDDVEGSIWKIVNADGDAAYVGHETVAATAITNGFNTTTGAITEAYDSAGRRFTYTYTSGMLTQVKAEVNDSGWVEVGKVDYAYYVNADTYGEDNDLELVTVTMPLTDSGVSVERNTYYRYYEGTYHATTNPGYHHQLEYVYGPEGFRNYDQNVATPITASENDLKPYASAFFEYDTSRRIVSAWFNGACGCSGGSGAGEHVFEYETNGSFSDTSGYDTAWETRTIVKLPDVTYKASEGSLSTYVTQYFDETGQPLARVMTDGDPDDTSPAPDTWATYVVRNSDGLVTESHSPANVTGYTHSSASFTTSTSAGLVTVFEYQSSGDTAGLLEHVKHQEGTSGSKYLDQTIALTTRSHTVGDAEVTRPLIASRRIYQDEITSGTTGSLLTSYSYTYHSATASDLLYLAVKKRTTTHPAVTTAKNGSNASDSMAVYLRPDGTTAFMEAEDGVFTYTKIEEGLVTTRIQDAKTNHGSAFASGDDPNTDFGITETGDGVHRVTSMTYDDQGRLDETTLPNDRVTKTYFSKLADERLVTLRFPKYVSGTSTLHGPVSASVANHAGGAEAQLTIELAGGTSTSALTAFIDEADTDPLLAVGVGTVARYATSIFDEAGGRVEETRSYFDIPGSGAGTDGTNYDASFIAYDDRGRRIRSEAPHGTISRTHFDALGRAVTQWIGTNDNGYEEGDSAGTADMVKVAETEYDSGADGGNSHVTKRTAFVEDGATDKRETSFEHDVRGRVLLVTSPTAPHTLTDYDNLGRATAVGQFSSTASIVVGTDTAAAETTNRMALSKTYYDERGRVYRTQRHKIDQSDGSDDDSLAADTWYDPVGRVIKVDGEQLTKTIYDRLGRATHQFTLASDNDTGYSDADDVTGDIVLLESQTTYESTDSDNVVMRASISRFHDDYDSGETTGALDTNADGDDLMYTAANIEGRIQITAMWFDDLDRITDSVNYGTYGAATFDRDGLAVPTRSDTALLSEFAYNDDGTQLSVTDPKDLESRTLYDDAGRRIATIQNYVNGTPSSATGDDDVYTRYEYTDGLQTKMWVDLDGDDIEDADDQVTEYTYGTTKGASAGDSKIGTGHLLGEIAYPDSSGASDVVSYAYNAQSQQVWMQDQSGNIVETDYDDSGRQTHRRVTTIDAETVSDPESFDDAVLRISTTYDDLGRRELVTQYDHATVGSGSVVDEVKFTYEDWGLISTFEQDHNSAVGASGSVDDYEISYTYAKSISGRNTIYRRTMVMPDGTTLTYTSESTDGLHDADARRVTKVKVGVNTLARYWYNGVGHVVGTELPEPDVEANLFSGTSGDYEDLDRFNRVTGSNWTSNATTAFDYVDFDITYDRNSNITLVEDAFHSGFDIEYTMDDLDRLVDAQYGTWNGSSITSESRQQTWTLDQVGNWAVEQLDVDADGLFTSSGERDDDRTHNVVNELLARDIDDDGTDDYDLVYDNVGNLTDDDKDYAYVYDAFGRLREIRKTSDSSLVTENTYNGLGFRIGEHYDVDGDGTVESTSDDPWFRYVYTDRWQDVATFRADDTDPKEQFVYHAAGASGFGGSSMLDAVIFRDKDVNTAWASASDGVLENRIYYNHNWRGDVVALINDGRQQKEGARYEPYGNPFGSPEGDTNSDGRTNGTDETQMDTWINASAYDLRGDMDLDGDVDATDKGLVLTASGTTAGYGELSNRGNRKAYPGFNVQQANAVLSSVRHRAYHAVLGRWMQRDPLGYVDGPSLLLYSAANPLVLIDPVGLACGSGWNDPWIPEDLPISIPGHPLPILVFYINVQSCCMAHDECYGQCRGKKLCDELLYGCVVMRICDGFRREGGYIGWISFVECLAWATSFYVGVRAFGLPAYCAACPSSPECSPARPATPPPLRTSPPINREYPGSPRMGISPAPCNGPGGNDGIGGCQQPI